MTQADPENKRNERNKNQPRNVEDHPTESERGADGHQPNPPKQVRVGAGA